MMRDFDATVLNRIVNHPAIKPHFTMNGVNPFAAASIDFTQCAAMSDYYVLAHNGEQASDPRADAAMIFELSAPRVWEMHTLFLPTCRGRRALDAAQQFGRLIFEELGARMVWGQTPTGNRAARWFNRQLGGKSDGVTAHPLYGPCEVFVCDRADWNGRRAK